MKYKVAKFEIDISQFRITCGSEIISTEPKVFDLIVYLIINRERLISREELFEKIWAGREVSDTTLSNHIKSARKILGDNGDLQRVIKTVRGRGYQFIADVVETPFEKDSLFVQPQQNKSENNPVYPDGKSSTANQSEINRISLLQNLWTPKTLGLLIVCLVILAFLGWQISDNSSPVIEADTRPYILVVPFGVSGGNNDKWEPFADQITREVILKLRKISGLRVIPASSAFTFKHNKTHAYIREQIPEVAYVLDAMVSVEGNVSIRITTELNDLFKEDLVWDEHYQSRIDDTNFFSVQTEIATSVSKSLKVAILADEQRSLSKQLTTNLAAYELYVAGQQQLNLLTHDSLRSSVALFSQAIALDPQFDAAYIAKADAFRMIMSYFEKPIDTLPYVIDAVLAALAINPDSAEAHSSLGLAYVFAWRWEDAWDMLNAARAEDPNLALTEVGFALYYSGLGDIAGVYESLGRANKLDPLNIELADWGHWALAMVGEIEAATEWGKNKIQLHPEVGMIYSGASVSASLAGDHERAISLAKKGVLLDSGSTYSLLALAQTYGHAGQLDKISPLLEQAEQHENYSCPYEKAVTYLLMNDVNKTFDLLNEAVAFRSNCLIFTRNDPRLKRLKSDPRFSALLTRVGLDNESIRKYPR